ncbi:SLAP domain-containing protein [Lacticaseibacillus brantae]|nr:SLAP domain-containing protein [Lacticaseibacillus brantae]
MKINGLVRHTLLAVGLGFGLFLGTAQHQTTVSAASGVVQVKYVPGYGIALWNSPESGHAAYTQKLLDGSKWRYSDVKQVNGQTWYQLGTNQWADGKYLTTALTSQPAETAKTGVITINYVPGYGVALRTSPNGNFVKPTRTLKHGTSWKYFAVSQAAGKTWYKVGTNQWVDGTYTGKPAAKPSTPSNNQNQYGVTNTAGSSSILGDSQTKIYHLPTQKNYQIRNDHLVRFSSEAAARAAGYRRSLR